MAEFVDYISMNLGDPNITAHDGRSQRIEPGTYDFEITKATFDQSKKGNRTLRVTVMVVSDDAMKGRSMIGTYVISEDEFARRRMKALIEAASIQLDASGGFSREALIGGRFTADVIIDTFDDIDSKTGLPVTKDFTKWIGERVYEGGAAPAARPAAAAAAPAVSNGAPRRPAAPAPNGNGAAARRS
jgi:hypothetical protein